MIWSQRYERGQRGPIRSEQRLLFKKIAIKSSMYCPVDHKCIKKCSRIDMNGDNFNAIKTTVKRFKKIAWSRFHHLQWKFKLLAGKVCLGCKEIKPWIHFKIFSALSNRGTQNWIIERNYQTTENLESKLWWPQFFQKRCKRWLEDP